MVAKNEFGLSEDSFGHPALLVVTYSVNTDGRLL